MKIKEFNKILWTGLICLAGGWFASKYSHTPEKAFLWDDNRDGVEDLFIESKLKNKIILYGHPENSKKSYNYKEFICGKELNEYLNPIWRKEYGEYFKEEPEGDKFNYKSEWE